MAQGQRVATAGGQFDNRVRALLKRMTLDEKLAQIAGVWSYEVLEENGQFSITKAKERIGNGIGHISRPATTSGKTLRELAIFNNRVQRFLIEETRLGIPAVMHEECLNGFMARGAPIFPQAIGLASTWEPELIGRMTGLIRQQMRAVGVHQGLSPVLDIARDPRWGRIEETYGEDPYLVARMGVAYIRGLQGNDPATGVTATLKHFAGYGLSEGGMNWAPSHIPPRLFREVYLYPFEKAVVEAGALAVMNAYQEIDGIPCGAAKELLTDILRRQWGFKGVVVADYFAVDMLQAYHKIAADKGEAGWLALEAGIDVELPQGDCYGEPLKRLVENGTVPLIVVDRAVTRVLRHKFMLGLFDHPYVDVRQIRRFFGLPGHRQFTREAAQKSIILLKNENNLLPLAKTLKRIAVIGPNADSQRNILGDYTYPAHTEFMAVRGRRRSSGGKAPGEVLDVPVVTILEGIREKIGTRDRVVCAAGCEITGDSRDGFAEAIAAARSAEVAVVVVGGKSGLASEATCGEMRDSATLELPGVQRELVEAIAGTGTATVVVLVNGRPLAMEWLVGRVAAIVQAWLPGEEGGNAIADVLFGGYNPGGKLPVSVPRTVGQVPLYYGHKPSGGRSQVWGDYTDSSASPLFEFGYGLSYTTFALSNLKIQPARVPAGGVVQISCTVANTGVRAGDEVVQLYINDVVASVTRPVKELKGFQRVHLEPAAKQTVSFELAADELAFYNREMKRVVEPGTFRVMVGRSSNDIALEGSFEVVARD